MTPTLWLALGFVAGAALGALALRATVRPDPLALVTLLQERGQLIDFLMEDVAGFTDAEVGAAAKLIHQRCREALVSWLTVEPVLVGEEGRPVQIPPGLGAAVRLVGAVNGTAPAGGVLVHKGWRSGPVVLQPAEVEVTTGKAG